MSYPGSWRFNPLWTDFETGICRSYLTPQKTYYRLLTESIFRRQSLRSPHVASVPRVRIANVTGWLDMKFSKYWRVLKKYPSLLIRIQPPFDSPLKHIFLFFIKIAHIYLVIMFHEKPHFFQCPHFFLIDDRLIYFQQSACLPL